ncbi:HdeD family acid-resistance protein [Rhodocaloribacter sp.]
MPTQTEDLRKFRTHSIIIGILMILLGIAGIFLPTLMSLTTSIFVGWLFVFGGLFLAYHIFRNNRKNWVAWFKAIVLLVVGVLLLVFPAAGVAALGMMLIVYFLLDSFSSIAAAINLRGRKGRGWMYLNSLLSLILAVIFIVGWPFSSMWLVGLFVGISLFMDGLALLLLGIFAHPA